MILIITSHSIPDSNSDFQKGAINIYTSTTDIQLIIAFFLKNLGQIGNHIFIMSSAWFLLESKKVKPNKIATMIGDCFFISVCMLVLFWILGYRFSVEYIKELTSPILHCNYWFVNCYLLLYVLHPVLNNSIELMSQKALLFFNMGFFTLYNFIGYLA